MLQMNPTDGAFAKPESGCFPSRIMLDPRQYEDGFSKMSRAEMETRPDRQ